VLLGLLSGASKHRSFATVALGVGSANGNINVDSADVSAAELEIRNGFLVVGIANSFLLVDVDTSATSKGVKTCNDFLMPLVVTLLTTLGAGMKMGWVLGEFFRTMVAVFGKMVNDG